MVYATSDLHGYPLSSLQDILRKADFQQSDHLFVLGDVIDRNGDGGVEALQWMMRQPNVSLIMGNHEAMLLSCAFLFEEVTAASIDGLTEDQILRLATWLSNGAQPTLESLRALYRRDPGALMDLLDYLRHAPLYDTVSAGGRDFLLVHSGLESFDPSKQLSEYQPDELLWCRPKPEQRYFDDVLTIIGHTPTALYQSPGRAFHTPTWIDIDTGLGKSFAPMLLRLNDLKEFYAD